jgi:hypothetical protein
VSAVFNWYSILIIVVLNLCYTWYLSYVHKEIIGSFRARDLYFTGAGLYWPVESIHPHSLFIFNIILPSAPRSAK